MTTTTDTDSLVSADVLHAISDTGEGLDALAAWIRHHPDAEVTGSTTPGLFWLDSTFDDIAPAVAILGDDHTALTRHSTTSGFLEVTREFGGGVKLKVLGVLAQIGVKSTRTVEVDDWVLPAELAVIPEAVTA